MPKDNASLHGAKSNKKDEFYTQLPDIEKEMAHYTQHFAGRSVYCNCDDPKQSMFWAYFHHNFAALGLSRLVATHYKPDGGAYKIEYAGGCDADKSYGLISPLSGDGDFRSRECLAALDDCDIVVTNPPFSLFREYMDVLISHNKKFLILGSMNALTYKNIFPLIRDSRLWYGATIHSGDREFGVRRRLYSQPSLLRWAS